MWTRSERGCSAVSSNGAIFRDARRKSRAGLVLRGAFRGKKEGKRERSTQPLVYRCGIIDISNCFDGEEVHRPRPGPAGRVAAGWNGAGWDGMGCDAMRCDATCPGSRIFEGARVDPVPPLIRSYK